MWTLKFLEQVGKQKVKNFQDFRRKSVFFSPLGDQTTTFFARLVTAPAHLVALVDIRCGAGGKTFQSAN